MMNAFKFLIYIPEFIKKNIHKLIPSYFHKEENDELSYAAFKRKLSEAMSSTPRKPPKKAMVRSKTFPNIIN